MIRFVDYVNGTMCIHLFIAWVLHGGRVLPGWSRQRMDAARHQTRVLHGVHRPLPRQVLDDRLHWRNLRLQQQRRRRYSNHDAAAIAVATCGALPPQLPRIKR